MAKNAVDCEDKFSRKVDHKQLFDVYHHHKKIAESEWASLPELTNDNGSYCADSCESQLWSIAVLLEAINTLKRFN
jgi:glycogen debranching enzyme